LVEQPSALRSVGDEAIIRIDQQEAALGEIGFRSIERQRSRSASSWLTFDLLADLGASSTAASTRAANSIKSTTRWAIVRC